MNKPEIRHRRLYAFYNSRTLGVLMLIVITSLLMADGSIALGWLLPLVVSATAGVLAIGYSLWFWICKPREERLDPWLSDATTIFTLYFLVVTAVKARDIWWFIPPMIAAVVIIFISLLRPQSAPFRITPKENDAESEA